MQYNKKCVALERKNWQVQLASFQDNIVLYLPESFVWLVLKSGVIQDSEISAILAAPYDYLESSEYFSWDIAFWVIIILRRKYTNI